jgi:hypothetical protein
MTGRTFDQFRFVVVAGLAQITRRERVVDDDFVIVNCVTIFTITGRKWRMCVPRDHCFFRRQVWVMTIDTLEIRRARKFVFVESILVTGTAHLGLIVDQKSRPFRRMRFVARSTFELSKWLVRVLVFQEGGHTGMTSYAGRHVGFVFPHEAFDIGSVRFVTDRAATLRQGFVDVATLDFRRHISVTVGTKLRQGIGEHELLGKTVPLVACFAVF